MTLRRLIVVTHRWLGLGSSLILAIVGVTGAILVWDRQSLIGRVAGPLHEVLLLGQFGWRMERIGWWIVVIVTMIAVALQLGGAMLWWKRKLLTIRVRSGWTKGLADLHHAAGVLALPLMLLLAVSGVAMAFITPDNYPDLRPVIFDLHTARNYSLPIQVLYTIATIGFMVQGVSGVVMWWGYRRPSWTKPRR